MTGYAGQDDQATDDGAAVWPGELDEQLISELLSDNSLLGALQVPAGDSEHNCSSVDTRPGAAPAPCNGGGGTAAEHGLPQPAAVSRALCSVYSGPTIKDIEKALSSRPCNYWSNRRYSPMYFGRFGAASRGPESRYAMKVRSCAGKMPSDGFKWRKYGQKSIKNNPFPRSYYKCTSSRCGAKKQVEKSVDYPDMLIVTYEGPHLHGPQPPFPRRQWPSADVMSEARGGGGAVVAGDLRGRQNGLLLRAENGVAVTATRSCDDGGGSSPSVAAPRDGTAPLPCDSPPATTWSCPDFHYSSCSPEAMLP